MANTPGWMRAVLRIERAIGDPLTRATNSPEGARVLVLLADGARLARTSAQAARAGLLHALSLPTHRDVQELDGRVERLQRSVDDLSAEQHDREART